MKSFVILPRFEDWKRVLPDDFSVTKGNLELGEIPSGQWELRIEDPHLNVEARWSAIRLFISTAMLQKSIVIDPDIRGGIPVLRGTRISVSQVLTEISDGETVEGFAEEYDIDKALLKGFFDGLAIHLDRSFVR